MVDRVDPSTPPALLGAGLRIDCDPSPDGGQAYVVSGKTFHHKETLKAHGGRWSQSRGAWVFDDPAKIERLCADFGPAGAASTTPGFAEAPMRFEPSKAPLTADRSQAAANGQRPHYHGHRKRLRARFMGGDGASIPDYELLELLLFFSIRYVDVKPLAKRLLDRFGSLGGVLAAEPKRLEEVLRSIDGKEREQISNDSYFTITQLKAMRCLLERVLAEDITDRPVISSWQALLDYLKVALGHEPIEQFRLLFLDKKNILIEDRSAVQPSLGQDEKERGEAIAYNCRALPDDVQQRGTVDHTPLYPREIAKRALELGASALIMVHNHPSGDPTPSRADIEMTKQVEAALAPIRVALHDHLIIGKDRHLSFKSEGLL